MEHHRHNTAKSPPTPVTPAKNVAPPPASEPLACRRCGVIAIPRVTPGTGPHALKANCPACGAFLQWLSTHPPAERARRQAQARLDAMAHLAPTELQLKYLKALGDTQPAPANRAAASQRIDHLKHAKGVA